MKRILSLTSLALLGCGADAETSFASKPPYNPDEATLIGAEPGGESVDVSECRDCEEVERDCGQRAAADVVFDEHGDVVDVICYERDVAVENVGVDQVDSADVGNNTVLVLDGDDDGLDVEGDITIEGNNAIVYGEGPDVSVVGGTLDIEKNNAIVRGVRILDDVTIIKNDTKLTFCVIEGDLTITGNNTTLAECVVYGNVRITGLNTVLVRNHFAGAEQLEGFNLTCNENLSFEDTDDDRQVDDDEVGGEVMCVQAEGNPDPQSDPREDEIAGDAGAPCQQSPTSE